MFKNFVSISLVVFGLTLPTVVSAEEIISENSNMSNHKKGSFYAFWGWNRGYYSDSDVHYKGDDYDFTLKGLSASDRPTEVGIDPYLNPLDLTLPQTNFKVGYFFKDNYALSFGVDHMKYVMDQGQTAIIEGEIDVDSTYDGTYDNDAIVVSRDFLVYEHTDGLNYLNLEINHFAELYAFTPNFRVSRIFGAGVGFLLPKTNATLLNFERHDDFHLAGWGTHLKTGIELSYTEYFFRSEVKTGYINMPDIRTTSSSSDTASQYFTFTEVNFLFGRYF